MLIYKEFINVNIYILTTLWLCLFKLVGLRWLPFNFAFILDDLRSCHPPRVFLPTWLSIWRNTVTVEKLIWYQLKIYFLLWTVFRPSSQPTPRVGSAFASSLFPSQSGRVHHGSPCSQLGRPPCWIFGAKIRHVGAKFKSVIWMLSLFKIFWFWFF